MVGLKLNKNEWVIDNYVIKEENLSYALYIKEERLINDLQDYKKMMNDTNWYNLNSNLMAVLFGEIIKAKEFLFLITLDNIFTKDNEELYNYYFEKGKFN